MRRDGDGEQSWVSCKRRLMSTPTSHCRSPAEFINLFLSPPFAPSPILAFPLSWNKAVKTASSVIPRQPDSVKSYRRICVLSIDTGKVGCWTPKWVMYRLLSSHHRFLLRKVIIDPTASWTASSGPNLSIEREMLATGSAGFKERQLTRPKTRGDNEGKWGRVKWECV